MRLASAPNGIEPAILAAYGLQGAQSEVLPHGNINQTYRLQHTTGTFILQRLHAVFKPQIHADIAAVTTFLAQHGQHITPRLLPTLAGAWWWQPTADAALWRLLTYIPGQTWAQAPTAPYCWHAGRLLGLFHHHMRTFDTPLQGARQGMHHTASHLQALEATLPAHRHHPAWAALEPLVHNILHTAEQLPALHCHTTGLVHGDPKLANMVFSATAPLQACALIDLDTLNRFALVLELGDAWRSWCNPCSEDSLESHLSPAYLAAALQGYHAQAGYLLQPEDVEDLRHSSAWIALELAARFARDTLEERYFGWDTQRFGAAWQHHLLRARSQWALCQSWLQQSATTWKLLKQTFQP